MRTDLAIIQRICPPYRVAIFRKLAEKVSLCLLYGRGMREGAFINSNNITGFRSERMATVSMPITLNENSYYISMFPLLLFRLLSLKPKVIITEGTTNILNNITVYIYHLLSKTPYVWWDAGRDINQKESGLRKMVNPILKFLMTRAYSCVAYGDLAKNYYLSIKIPEENIFIAQNTAEFYINEEKSEYLPERIEKLRTDIGLENEKIILYVGAIEKKRKIDLLLSAMKEVNKEHTYATLIIIGDGPESGNLKKYADKLGLKNVKFLGRIHESINDYYRLCDFVVLPGWSSLTVPQAMVNSKPIITVPYGGPEYELIKQGESGYVIERNSVEDLLDAIKNLLSDEELVKRMGAAGKKIITSSASIDNMVCMLIKATTIERPK